MLKAHIIKLKISLAILVLLIGNSFSQDTIEYPSVREQIVADRPGQTDAPQLISKGFIQIETGFQKEFGKVKIEKQQIRNTTCSTLMLKYGISKYFELRLVSEYATDKIKLINSDNSVDTVVEYFGLSPVSFGFKMALRDENKMLPEISVLTNLKLPYLGSDNYKTEYAIPQCIFLFSHTLNKRFNLSYNMGAEWPDESVRTTGIYAASLGMNLSDNLAVFFEQYGFLKKHTVPDCRLDGGLTYIIKNNMQLDCSGGIGLTEESPKYFISAGLSVRFNTSRKTIKIKNST
jgi:hypothetical protein